MNLKTKADKKEAGLAKGPHNTDAKQSVLLLSQNRSTPFA